MQPFARFACPFPFAVLADRGAVIVLHIMILSNHPKLSNFFAYSAIETL
jgi:hypothetical protein